MTVIAGVILIPVIMGSLSALMSYAILNLLTYFTVIESILTLGHSFPVWYVLWGSAVLSFVSTFYNWEQMIDKAHEAKRKAKDAQAITNP